jgi:hypothetical protein
MGITESDLFHIALVLLLLADVGVILKAMWRVS